jgi:excisionase family DNA binding protein
VTLDDAQLDTLAAMVAEHVARRERPRLVDSSEAAELLGVPSTWLLAEARADRIPHVRLGKYVRYEPDALVAWWRAEHAHGPSPAVPTA